MERRGGIFAWALGLTLALQLLLLWTAPAHAQTSRRVALVIGNGTYASGGQLTNPANDARLVAGALRQANFQTVELKADLGLAAFQRALRDFQAKADGAEVALVYYAGHGIEANGKNWLIPTDAQLPDARALPYEAVSLDLVMDAIGGAKVRVLLLDACRDNPFGRTWRSGSRSLARGLAQVEVDDVLVIFAAASGQTAADGAGGNSPFATAVARRLPQAGLPIQLLAGVVRDDVLRATNNAQRPFISASITGEPFYLVGTGQAAAAPPAQSVMTPAPAPEPARSPEETSWASAERINTAPAYQEYLRLHPQGPNAGMARAAIAALTPRSAAVATLAIGPEGAAPFLGRWLKRKGSCIGRMDVKLEGTQLTLVYSGLFGGAYKYKVLTLEPKRMTFGNPNRPWTLTLVADDQLDFDAGANMCFFAR